MNVWLINAELSNVIEWLNINNVFLCESPLCVSR